MNTVRTHLHLLSAKTWGGGEQYVLNLAKIYHEHGNPLVIIADNRYPSISSRFEKFAKVYSVSFNLLKLRSCLSTIKKIYEENNCATINYHSGKLSLIVSLLHKIYKFPTFFFKHNITNGKNDPYHRFIRANTSAIICVSQAVRKHLIDNITDTPVCHTIYNGVFTKNNTSSKNIDNHPISCIGYAGRITQNKGIELILQASLLLPKIKIRIAGDINHPYGQMLAKKYPTADFLGHVDDISAFYNTIDVLIYPSIVPEAFGLSICEAMMHGIPVISSKSGAQEEIITHLENGLLLDELNPENIAYHISLLDNPSLYQKLSTNAKQTVCEKFTMEKLYENLNKLYNSLT